MKQPEITITIITKSHNAVRAQYLGYKNHAKIRTKRRRFS